MENINADYKMRDKLDNLSLIVTMRLKFNYLTEYHQSRDNNSNNNYSGAPL